MNPFSRFLRSLLPAEHQPRVETFIEHWDALETLVIRVYKQDYPTPDDRRKYAALARWLTEHYPEHEMALRRHWPDALEGGHQPLSDPFRRLFTADSAAAFVGNWPALQALPPAREALNRYLIELREGA